MDARAEAKAVYIRMEADDKSILSILIHSDGTVNRTGDGTLRGDQTMRIGTTRQPLFDKYMNSIPEHVFEHAGKYDYRDSIVGIKCKLEILFIGAPGFEFHYGSESEGVFTEVGDMVTKAIEITDKWLEDEFNGRS